MINENTQYVHVNVKATYTGDDGKDAVRKEVSKIFVGDGETVRDKRRLLKERVDERMNIWFDLGYETIYAD